MSEEEIKFNFNQDIVYQIEMMSYMRYNDGLCSINEHLGEIFSYQDLKNTEEAQLKYEKDLSYKAIKQLQNQLQQKDNIIKEVREYNQKVYDTTEGNEKILAQTNLKILDKENQDANT